MLLLSLRHSNHCSALGDTQTRQRVSTSSLEADVSPAGTHTAHGCLLLAYLVIAWRSLTVFSNRVGGVHN